MNEVGAEVAALVVKAMVARPRPAGAVLEDAVATASFPSSHTVRATAAVGFLFVALVWRAPAGRSWRLPALVVAVVFLLVLGVARVGRALAVGRGRRLSAGCGVGGDGHGAAVVQDS